jgi:putative nucleotidyltransferase with HDIG domain
MYVVQRIPVSDIHQCRGILAEDVIGKDGAILLPKGAVLPWNGDAAAISEKLLRQGVNTLLLRKELFVSVEELEDLLRQGEISVARVDPELAKKTVHQIGEVFERMYETGGAEEDLTALTDTGRLLARELSRTPQILFSLAAVRKADEYTYAHSLNVALLTGFLASKLFPDQPDVVEAAATGGLLHDLGKAKVPLEILNKPAKLDDREFSVMRHHPLWGEELARQGGITNALVLSVIRSHHERWQGGGYPDNLSHNEIPLLGRVGAVADVFDALTSKRVYKEPSAKRQALNLLVDHAGDHFDPHIVRTLLAAVGLFPPGSVVELSDGRVGVVLASADRDLMRPQVLVSETSWHDAAGMQIATSVLDLSHQGAPRIVSILGDLGKIPLS